MGSLRQKVALEGMRFSAFHGYYPEEQVVGNEFLVDVETEFAVNLDVSDELNKTINYERIFEITSVQMKQTRKLLETVVHAILQDIMTEFPIADRICVSIKKMDMPLPGEVKNSWVQLTYQK